MLENLVESGQNLENMMKKTWKNIWKPMEQKYMVENVEKIWKNVWGNQSCQADMEKKHLELMGTRWTALEKS